MTKDAERRTRQRALAEAMFVDPEHNATAFRIAFDPVGVLALLDEIDQLARRVEVGKELAVDLRLCDPAGDRAKHIYAPEDDEIALLCERVGYGAVMDAAARLWRRKDPVGAHTVGPCAGTIQVCLAAWDQASREGE